MTQPWKRRFLWSTLQQISDEPEVNVWLSQSSYALDVVDRDENEGVSALLLRLSGLATAGLAAMGHYQGGDDELRVAKMCEKLRQFLAAANFGAGFWTKSLEMRMGRSGGLPSVK